MYGIGSPSMVYSLFSKINVGLRFDSMLLGILQRDMEARMGKNAMQKEGEGARWEAKFREMQATIQRNESIIVMLKAQVEQYQRQAEDVRTCLVSLIFDN